MTIPTFIRLAAAGGLALTLTACMDVAMTVDVTSQTEAEATMVTTMERDMYDLMLAQAPEDQEEFCASGELVETADIVECTVARSGTLDELKLDSEAGGEPIIEAIGDGQVRVAFPSGALAAAAAEDTGSQDDPQMQAMIASIFEGHTITLTVSGGRIVDTNMEIAADGQSARYEIPFTELFGPDLALPPELYAVVQK